MAPSASVFSVNAGLIWLTMYSVCGESKKVTLSILAYAKLF